LFFNTFGDEVIKFIGLLEFVELDAGNAEKANAWSVGHGVRRGKARLAGKINFLI